MKLLLAEGGVEPTRPFTNVPNFPNFDFRQNQWARNRQMCPALVFQPYGFFAENVDPSCIEYSFSNRNFGHDFPITPTPIIKTDDAGAFAELKLVCRCSVLVRLAHYHARIIAEMA